MRLIKTFVLHLYVDSDAPDRVCGGIRPLDDAVSYSFKDPIEFEELLHLLVEKWLLSKTSPPGGDSNLDM